MAEKKIEIVPTTYMEIEKKEKPSVSPFLRQVLTWAFLMYLPFISSLLSWNIFFYWSKYRNTNFNPQIPPSSRKVNVYGE